MKKLILTLAILLTMTTISANAAGFGSVDYGKVVLSYPLATKYKKELDDKATSLKNYLEQKQNDIINAKEMSAKEAIKKQAMGEVEKREKEYIALKAVRENEIDQKIRAACEKVRTAKKLDAVFRSENIVAGGVDCTQDVIKELGGK